MFDLAQQDLLHVGGGGQTIFYRPVSLKYLVIAVRKEDVWRGLHYRLQYMASAIAIIQKKSQSV